jgi:3-phenylpropionate/trans-cinnamate dioxygenase ferredoxin subunit
MGERVVLCRRDELGSEEVRRFEVAGTAIAVVRIGDEVYALADRCSHEDYPLSEGEVWAEDCTLECARHGSTFDLRTGEPCSLPATMPVTVYEVDLSGDEVAVVLP